MTYRLLAALLFALILVTFGCSSEPAAEPAAEAGQQQPVEVAEAKRFDPKELKGRLDAGENVYLLDVRNPEELVEHGAIEGYVNIPIDQLESRVSEVPKDRKVVVYCMRGGRAGRGAELLAKSGHTDIEIGGITEWKEAGLPVVQPKGTQ